MKAIHFAGPGRVVLEEVSDPKPTTNEVVVRLKSAALCSADLDPYHGKKHAGVGQKAQDPVIPGHEGCGVVEKVGPNVYNLKEGDRVAIYIFVSCGHCSECQSGSWMLCRAARCVGFDLDGCDAEQIVIPDRNCLKLPNSIDFDEGCLITDLLGTTYSAARKIDVASSDYVAVFGAGPIGICETAVCRAMGADVIVIDVIEERLEQSKKFGADVVINSSYTDPVQAIRDITGTRVVKAIDCSGNSQAEIHALSSVSLHGSLVFVGWGTKTEIRPVDQVITRDLTVRGSWYFNISDFERMTNFVQSKKIPLKDMITHRFKLNQASEAFDLFDKKKTLKVVLHP